MAISTLQDRGVEEFLRKADLAMYDAKRGGKRRAQMYEPRLEEGARTVGGQWFARDDEQRAEIESVLADPGGITMVFQPIMDLRTGRVAGYESLSRFNREPRRTPDLWFAQAHRCGLGYALEAKAILSALAHAGSRPAGTYLTFNLSPSSLLSDQVMRVLPERLDGLVIEITENELVSGDPAIHKALAGLRGRGARLAVDDTGAGYAGLTHVMRLQPDIIKLDRALTTGVDSDPAKAPLISSFVRYARDIDAAVCAEGVETLAELERLADLDVAYGQGFGIARPSAPWVPVAAEATAACLHSFQATLADAGHAADPDYDRRLELLARRLASVDAAPGGRSRGGRPARTRLRLVPDASDHPRRRGRRPPRGLRDRSAPVEPLPDRPRARDLLPARRACARSAATSAHFLKLSFRNLTLVTRGR
jgi:EAL domain-containing protein (putative c-di-GMP-specific phosphodiesterase class I)